MPSESGGKEFATQQLTTFLEKVSSSSSTPGGGTTSALLAAMSASLVSMVASLSSGKDAEVDFEKIKEEAVEKRERSIELMVEDANAFRQVMEAYRMPKETDGGESKRSSRIEEALKAATLPPMDVAKTCCELLDLCEKVVRYGKESAITDGGAAAIYADAAARSALLNVDVNLLELEEESSVSQKKSRREKLQKYANRRSKEVLKLMKNKLKA